MGQIVIVSQFINQSNLTRQYFIDENIYDCLFVNKVRVKNNIWF